MNVYNRLVDRLMRNFFISVNIRVAFVIIGRQGSKIKELEQNSGARIKVCQYRPT